ncbi:MAG: NAD(P)-dependent oxidoreductase [Solirubrobacterales bacterium]|nr:NAD(P)-dependent oxidoreductase [Solirubrobacterales bacterium]
MAGGKKIAITGAAGFIGLAAAKRLIEEGNQVVGIDINPEGEALVVANGANWVQCSTTDRSGLDSALKGVDGVIHTAAIVSDHGTMENFIEVNVRGTRNAIDAAQSAGATAFVHISSVASWGYEFARPPRDDSWTRRQGVPYVDTKAASDDLALRRGAAVVRPGDVYGPRSTPWSVRPLEAMKRGRFVLPGSGEGLMTPVFVDDLVDLALRALVEPAAAGRAVTGFSGEPVTAATFFDHYATMLGKARTPTAPRPLAAGAATVMELLAKLTGKPPEVSRTAMVFISRKAGYSTDLAQSLLGWQPTTTLAEGMQLTEEWFRETGLLPNPSGT